MELIENWAQIKSAFGSGVKSSLHCAIASIGPDGWPHVTPIGFIFLRDDYTAFYFEEYPKKLPQNIAHDPRICLLSVNSSKLFWLGSLFSGKFQSSPGIRLYGIAGERRRAVEAEKLAYLARVKPFRRLTGYDLLWKNLEHVRDVRLERFEPVVYPRMTEHLWQ